MRKVYVITIFFNNTVIYSNLKYKDHSYDKKQYHQFISGTLKENDDKYFYDILQDIKCRNGLKSFQPYPLYIVYCLENRKAPYHVSSSTRNTFQIFKYNFYSHLILMWGLWNKTWYDTYIFYRNIWCGKFGICGKKQWVGNSLTRTIH